jgi:hypothetical protein
LPTHGRGLLGNQVGGEIKREVSEPHSQKCTKHGPDCVR